MRFDQGSRVYVTPNPSYKSQDKLTGICGNFNGRDQDDLTLPDKNTDAADDTEFGYAWRDEEDCPYPVSLDPCSDNPDRQGWAEKGKLEKKSNRKLTWRCRNSILSLDNSILLCFKLITKYNHTQN